jgi:hypothetical protein
MALGWIPMYNHSYKQLRYFMDFDDDTMFIKTLTIQKGES